MTMEPQPAAGTPLAPEQGRLERELGTTVLALGLFRRVNEGGCLVQLIGGAIGTVIAAVLMGAGSFLVAAVAGKEWTGGIGLVAIVLGLGAGQGIAADMLRRAKEIPGDFATAVTADGVFFYGWSVRDKAVVLTAPGPQAIRWPRASVSVATGTVELRPAAVPAVAATAEPCVAVRFLLNREPQFTAQVLSVVAEDDGSGVSVRQGPAANAVFDLYKEEEERA